MVAYKRILLFLLLLPILAFTLLGSQSVEQPGYVYWQQTESTGNLISNKFGNEPVMDLLGKTFDELKQVLGEPDEQGRRSLDGEYNYVFYRYQEGSIKFCSPAGLDNNIVVSIIIGPGQEIYGVRAGMLFSEIMAILGTPDIGPEPGINNTYYMEYYLGETGETKYQTPEVLISFSSADINGPTQNIFIKWEAYEYNQKDHLQTKRQYE